MKRGKVWIAALVLFVLFLVACGTAAITRQTVIRHATDDVGHVLGFAVLAVLVAEFARNSKLVQSVSEASFKHRHLPWLLGLGVVAMVGGGIEFLQQFAVNRSARWSDFARDCQGAAMGLLLWGAVRNRSRRWLGWKRILLVSLALVLLAAAIKPWLQVCYAYYRRTQIVPVVFQAENALMSAFVVSRATYWTPAPPPPYWPRKTEQLFRLELLPDAEYSGIGIHEPIPDWSAYQSFCFEIWLEGDSPIELVIRIHDDLHDDEWEDRFNRKLIIQPGYQIVRISLDDIASGPQQRRLDMTRVFGIGLYADHPTKANLVWLDRMWLE